MKQYSMFTSPQKKCFGGSLLIGKRKCRRPLSTKHAMHLTLRSDLVVSLGTFLRHRKFIEQQLKFASEKWGLRVYRHGIEANHIHILVKIPNRTAYKYFIQYFTGVLANFINPNRTGEQRRFWTFRPHTRIVE